MEVVPLARVEDLGGLEVLGASEESEVSGVIQSHLVKMGVTDLGGLGASEDSIEMQSLELQYAVLYEYREDQEQYLANEEIE